jgi:hypothetical protein
VVIDAKRYLNRDKRKSYWKEKPKEVYSEHPNKEKTVKKQDEVPKENENNVETEKCPRPKARSRREFFKDAGLIVGGVAAGALAAEPARIVSAAATATGQEKVYEVVPPYGVPSIKVLQPVKRVDTLEGKTIGGMGAAFHFPETWKTMVEVLKKKYPTAKFVNPDQIPSSKMADQAGVVDPAAIAADIKKFKLDVVIVGNGC